MWNGIRILLGVCGGIAAYKSVQLASLLSKQGALVDVVMTKGAQQFVTPLTFQSITRRTVFTETFDERDSSVVSHIDLADHTDLALIAPATANVLGKLANGIADDMLTTTLLASRAPLILAPAMNGHMWQHPAVQSNVETLIQRGARLLEPANGMLACGYVGQGRLPEPEDIAKQALQIWLACSQGATPMVSGGESSPPNTAWSGKRVWITAGGTREPLDPVRYIGNSSSGKMGFALAEAAHSLGAKVIVVAANVHLPTPVGVERIDVQTALEMHDLVMNRLHDMDVLIKSAAVADSRPSKVAIEKIKKNDEELIVTLVKNPDILYEIGQLDVTNRPFLIGFAAETEKLLEHAQAKLKRKRCDLLIANQVSLPGVGFGSDQNEVIVMSPDERYERFHLQDKKQLAFALMRWIAPRLEQRNGGLQ